MVWSVRILQVGERDYHPLLGCPHPVLSQGMHLVNCFSLDPGRLKPALRQLT